MKRRLLPILRIALAACVIAVPSQACRAQAATQTESTQPEQEPRLGRFLIAQALAEAEVMGANDARAQVMVAVADFQRRCG